MDERLLRVAELPQTPWRNGGGVTTAIAAEPAGASFDDCLWRVDLSDIGRAGPFSHLAGLDRTIVPLANGLVLTVNGTAHELSPLDPFDFAGEDVTTCRTAAPLRAFNAFARRGAAAGIVERWLGGGRITGPGAAVLYVVRGSFHVGGCIVQEGSALVTAGPVDIEPSAQPALALSAVFRSV